MISKGSYEYWLKVLAHGWSGIHKASWTTDETWLIDAAYRILREMV